MSDPNLIHEVESIPPTPEQRAAKNVSPIAVEVALSGKIDRERFCLALETVISRHDIFKQAFSKVPGFVDEQMVARSYAAYSFVFNESSFPEQAENTRINLFDFSDGSNIKIVLDKKADGDARLHLAVPSIVADYNSLVHVITEISRIYDGTELTEPFQYSQFAAWRRSLEEDAQDGLLYWSSYLEEWPQPLGLPLHKHEFSSERDSFARRLNVHLDETLTAFTKQRNVSFEVVVQAAWWLLLARLSGQKIYRASWRHDCRDDYEIMIDGIGVFEKHLPLEVNIDLDSSFDSWLLQLKLMLEKHKEAQEFWPIDETRFINEVQVGFGFTSIPEINIETLTFSFCSLPSYCGTDALYLNVVRSIDGTTFVIHYDPAQYDPAVIDSLFHQYEKLLGNIAECPQAQMRILASESQAIALSGTPLDCGSIGVFHYVERWMHETPDAEAIRFGTTHLSYLDFETKVGELASFLISNGVRPGVKVALCANRSERLIIALFAIWRAGATYVPLDPSWPEARKLGVIVDCGALFLFDGDQWISCQTQSAALPTDNNEQPAYVIYTSGSTGLPKGVAIGHSELANYVFGASQSMRLAESRRWAMIGNLAADLGYTGIFGALANGGCLLIAEDKDLQDSLSFSRFVAANNIDGMKIVPSQLDALLDDSIDMALPKKLVLGGEPSDMRLVRRIRSIAPHSEIYNHYGPTETTVGVMIGLVEAGVPENIDPLTLTTALPNNKTYILDDKLNCVLSGSVGELYIGGKQLGRYLKAADSHAFVDSPFDRNERLYRSGDLACYLPQGGIRLLGRADQQIKIRGYRVEPGEVERALKLCVGVHDAIILYRDEQLCAYVIGDDDLEAKKESLRRSVAAHLPDYMIPAHFIFVEKFARLASGKIDRQALLVLPLQREAKALTPPCDAVEAFLCRTMAKLLKRNDIGADQDFFELGGHSLLVIKLLARIRQSLEIDLPPSLFFDHTTPQALAIQLRAASQKIADLERLAATCRDDEVSLQSEVA